MPTITPAGVAFYPARAILCHVPRLAAVSFCDRRNSERAVQLLAEYIARKRLEMTRRGVRRGVIQ